jgi:hypothetical protein
MNKQLSALVISVGLAMTASAADLNKTILKLHRNFTFSGGQTFRIDCPKTSSSKCQLIQEINGYEMKRVSLSKTQSETIVHEFLAAMKSSHRTIAMGNRPLIRWEMEGSAPLSTGSIAAEDVEQRRVDRVALTTVTGLEMRLTSLIVK